MGYGDVSAYGSKTISTPNIDKLANGGVCFTDGHATSATSTPSRYAMFTGSYPWKNKNAKILPGDAPLLIDTAQFTMPKMSIDTYTEYLELAEVIDAKQRYSKQDIEAMGLFICKAYGDQFTVEELKNPETGLDAAGLILEFQFIDMGIADDLTKRMEKIEKNFQSGK